MKPNIQIINDDCMNYLSNYSDNYFQLALVDPPYGIGDFRTSESKKIHKNIQWNEKIPGKEYFKELKRVSKNQIIWGVNYYTDYVKDVGRIVHDKTGGGIRDNTGTLSNCDIASHSFGVNMRIFHYLSIGNVVGNDIDWHNKRRWHPCQKPVALYKWLLYNYAKKEDHILDTHMGSGTIALACWELGFDLTAFEIDKDYCDLAENKLEQYKKRPHSFF